MPIAEKAVAIELNGRSHRLFFNANCMCAYEEATGKFFMDTLASLYDVMRPIVEAKGAAKLDAVSSLDVIRKVPMRELRALIWAALHEYDAQGEPVWRLTIAQVGRMIQLQDVPRIFTAFLKGQMANSPTAAEMGESRAASEESPTITTGAPQREADGGGEPSIELPADAFA